MISHVPCTNQVPCLLPLKGRKCPDPMACQSSFSQTIRYIVCFGLWKALYQRKCASFKQFEAYSRMLVATVFNFHSIPGDLKVSKYSQTLEIFWLVCMGPCFGSAWSRMHGLSWKTPSVQVNNCDIFFLILMKRGSWTKCLAMVHSFDGSPIKVM